MNLHPAFPQAVLQKHCGCPIQLPGKNILTAFNDAYRNMEVLCNGVCKL